MGLLKRNYRNYKMTAILSPRLAVLKLTQVGLKVMVYFHYDGWGSI